MGMRVVLKRSETRSERLCSNNSSRRPGRRHVRRLPHAPMAVPLYASDAGKRKMRGRDERTLDTSREQPFSGRHGCRRVVIGAPPYVGIFDMQRQDDGIANKITR